jgi:hypothetical protein
MSRNMKIVLAVVGVVVLVGCLGVLAVGFMGARFAQQAIDPAKARAVAAQIADYELPAGYREIMGLDFVGTKMVMVGPEGMMTATSSNGVPQGMVIMLSQLPPGSGSAEQMQAQMVAAMGQRGGLGSATMKPGEKVDATIRGQPVTLLRSEGTAKDGTAVRMLSGAFEGKGGPAMLIVFGGTDHWDDAQVTAFLESMR